LDKFRDVGLIHIVVLSGYNITLITDFVRRIFIFLPRFLYLIITLGFIFLFVVMVGAGPGVTRAGIMASIVIVARFLYRPNGIGRVLIISGLIMVIINPDILFYDPGFQLSFMATIGLVYLTPYELKISPGHICR
jgi:competence protein ComEC